MNPEEKIVTGCYNCPLWGEYLIFDDLNHTCYHPDNKKKFEESFDGCPLKENSLIIKLQR